MYLLEFLSHDKSLNLAVTGPSEFGNLEDSIELTINKFKYHPSILMIKNKLSNKEHLSFREVSLSEVVKKVKIPKKAIKI